MRRSVPLFTDYQPHDAKKANATRFDVHIFIFSAFLTPLGLSFIMSFHYDQPLLENERVALVPFDVSFRNAEKEVKIG